MDLFKKKSFSICHNHHISNTLPSVLFVSFVLILVTAGDKFEILRGFFVCFLVEFFVCIQFVFRMLY